MGIVTTYVCDISGKSSQDKTEFVEITITGCGFGDYNKDYPDKQRNYYQDVNNKKIVNKFVYKDVAEKFGLIKAKEETSSPEVTFESKLIALLQDWKDSIVEEATENAIQSVRN